MKLSDFGIHIRSTGKTTCPKCSHERKNKHDKCLSVDVEKGIWNCHNCGWNGGLPKKTEMKIYDKPKWTNNTTLSERLVKWFSARGISQQVLIDLKIQERNEFMPQTGREENCICFNYFKGEELVNIKYRDGAKNFKMFKNAEPVFYNLNSLVEANSCIITEGEIDCLSFLQAGFKSVVSVPNGASKGNAKLEYLENCWEYFEPIGEIIIATDCDMAGIALRNELARRLGIEKCKYIDFGDCKDANEYLCKHGAISLHDLKPIDFPVQGIIFAKDINDDIDDLYFNGFPKTKKLGIPEIDEYLSFDEGSFVIVTGIPNHGKSEFVDFMACILNTKHEWRFGIFSPENFPLKYHFSKIAEKIVGKPFHGANRINQHELTKAKEYINDNFFFIRPDDEDFSIDTVLNKAKILVKKYGIKALILDPYNRFEHQMEKGMTETNYISLFLDKINKFREQYLVTVFLIAHPRKINKDKATGFYEVPTLYDISGSSNFFNKPDIGISVYRNFNNNNTEVYIQKCRWKHLGKQGFATFVWNKDNGRYTLDNSNWIESPPNQSKIAPNDLFLNPDKFHEPIIYNDPPF